MKPRVMNEITKETILERSFMYRIDASGQKVEKVPCIIRHANNVSIRQAFIISNILTEQGFERAAREENKIYWTLKT